MQIEELAIPGVRLLTPQIFQDERGYFFEVYRRDRYAEAGIDEEFVQENESGSVYGTIRGLHWQLPPHTQTKLLRVVAGRILDVMLDLRPGSAAFGRHLAIELEAEKRQSLLVPAGLAHGFAVLSDYARISYRCDNYYAPGAERTIDPLDPALGIDWQIPVDRMILSAKDRAGCPFAEAEIHRFD